MWTRPGDIPKKFSLSPEELDHVETCDSDEEQRRFLEQIVIDKDLPVAMRTIQVSNNEIHRCTSDSSEALPEITRERMIKSICRALCATVRSARA